MLLDRKETEKEDRQVELSEYSDGEPGSCSGLISELDPWHRISPSDIYKLSYVHMRGYEDKHSVAERVEFPAGSWC